MGRLKAELSTRNQYHLSKDRYYELQHFCLQYNEWAELYSKIYAECFFAKLEDEFSDPTGNKASLLTDLTRAMNMVQETAFRTSTELANYIFEAVTEGRSYNYLRTRENIPCGRNQFYELYRKFFWLLSEEKGIY